MATVDFTLEDLKKVFSTKDDLNGVETRLKLQVANSESRVKDVMKLEIADSEERIKNVMKLEVADSEARIKREIKHFVDVDHNDLKGRMVKFGKSAVEIFSR
jgi:hypothetical protein